MAARGLRALLRSHAFAGVLLPGFALVWAAAAQEASRLALGVLAAALAASALLGWRRGSALSRRLRTLSSVLSAYGEGDFSMRMGIAASTPALEDAIEQVNQLGDALRKHRLGELEAWTLLHKVVAEVDVVVLAFDDGGQLKLANRAASKLLRASPQSLLGQSAAKLGLADLLSGAAPRIVKDCPPLGAESWELRRGAFRLAGKPHALIVLSDVGGALREQEREAWKRLIRVMGHEINNSLAPIQSIAQNMLNVVTRAPRPEDWEEDLQHGLKIVARRAEGLSRFMVAYAQLARLPPPVLAPVNVTDWVSRVVALEVRISIDARPGPTVSLMGDAAQLDQLLINLVKNGVDASLECGGKVSVSWSVADGSLTLRVEDDGAGVPNSANLFVPFFTTKPSGSGIGLALARQIAEAHGGEVWLRNRSPSPGAEAVVFLPLAPRRANA
jgi:signal transduction histidine kinase